MISLRGCVSRFSSSALTLSSTNIDICDDELPWDSELRRCPAVRAHHMPRRSPPMTATSPLQCSRNWSSQLDTVDNGHMISVARLLAFIRHDLAYSASALSSCRSALAFAFCEVGGLGSLTSGMPHTLPANCAAFGASCRGGGGRTLSRGNAENVREEGRVAAIRETQVIVFPEAHLSKRVKLERMNPERTAYIIGQDSALGLDGVLQIAHSESPYDTRWFGG